MADKRSPYPGGDSYAPSAPSAPPAYSAYPAASSHPAGPPPPYADAPPPYGKGASSAPPPPPAYYGAGKGGGGGGSGGGGYGGGGYDGSYDDQMRFTDVRAAQDYDPEMARNQYVGDHLTRAKNRFIFRVYAVLVLMLTITTSLTALLVFNDSAREWAQRSLWMLITSWVVSMVIMFVLFCVRKKSPINAILLFVWTTLMSWSVAVTCSFYNQRVVFEAFGITAGIFITLTIYVLVTKADFRFLGGFLFAALFALVFASLIQWLFPPAPGWVNMLFAVIGALVFTGYILYDTSLLLHTFSNDLDEWVLPAISLFLDFINLLLFILRIFGRK